MPVTRLNQPAAAAAKKTPKKKAVPVSGKHPSTPTKKLRPGKAGPGKTKKQKDGFQASISPMLATLIDQPFDKEGWIYEVKWDGYRCIALLHGGKTMLLSRNNKSFNEKFYPVFNALDGFRADMILDGEVIVANANGVSDFSKLQQWRSEADGELVYYVFDLLWLNGKSLIDLPLTERRALLKKHLPDHPMIRLSEVFSSTGTVFFDAAKKMGLEGIIAKKADAPYLPGERTRDWLKIKAGKRQEMVIGGFTKNEGSSKPFSSLLVGVFSKNKLRYTGKIGTGFSVQLQTDLLRQFQPLIAKTCPFDAMPDINKPSRFRPDPPKATAIWLAPKLVCEVSYAEMTEDGVMRHPSFEGMRTDKKATAVVEEKAIPVKRAVRGKSILHQEKLITANAQEIARKTFLNPKDETQERNLNGHLLKFTNLSKIYWPAEKITKRELLNYYYQVAPFMLPYMKDRPQSLNRHPNGITGESFYQKDVTGKVPAWIKTFPYHSEQDHRDKQFMVCTDEASLLYIASLGCIEMNPWSSRIQSPDNPDWCIIDLDPDTNPFDKVIETAQVTKQVLDLAGIPSFCKTSGSTGLHIYIPLGAKYSYEASKEFARLIVTIVQARLPQFTSIVRATKDRKGKIYLDFLQNRPQATLATAYSARPKPGATVSMPLHWGEVKKGLSMKDFTIRNAVARLAEQGDLFKGVLGKGINMKKCIHALEQINARPA